MMLFQKNIRLKEYDTNFIRQVAKGKADKFLVLKDLIKQT